MCPVMQPPFSTTEPVTDILHGIPVIDPYRWLEDPDSLRTRAWIAAQTSYARAYLDSIPGRDCIRNGVQELLDVETVDSIQKAAGRYFFRKRLRGQEQPGIYMREGPDGADRLLIDPAARGTGTFTAVKPLRVSPDGKLLLYEVKQGGERTGTFELFDVETRQTLPDKLGHGYLRGFAFARDGKSFYYVHEATAAESPYYRAVYQHFLGKGFDEDQEIFCAGEDKRLRLTLVSGKVHLGFLVSKFLERTLTDFYLWPLGSEKPPRGIIHNAEYSFGPFLLERRVLARTDRQAPNGRIVEVLERAGDEPLFVDVVPESECKIQNCMISGNRIYVAYIRSAQSEIVSFGLSHKSRIPLPNEAGKTVRLVFGNQDEDELLVERESFAEPVAVYRCNSVHNVMVPWFEQTIPLDPRDYSHAQVWFKGRDGASIPMFLAGRRDVLAGGARPTVMTSYGGYGVPMTPQFSVFVALLMERGCLFALPNIRGGSEFGVEWHNAAKRRNRQVAFDDFLGAAEWLLERGLAAPGKLAIFGGSNSGLLVGAALTQRPDLFCAVLCMVPLLDMLRYHLFDDAYVWKEEFGTADDSQDFSALLRYSPYHAVREGTAYPATMIVSGHADGNCNPLHARKMTAALQVASASDKPIFLDYCRFRGHSPVLPLHERINALTDRVTFFCDQLRLPVEIGA